MIDDQLAKKVMSGSLGPLDYTVRLVDFVQEMPLACWASVFLGAILHLIYFIFFFCNFNYKKQFW